MMTSGQSRKEEIANAVTHGIGVLLAIAALTLLSVFAAMKGTAWHVVSFSIFGATLVMLYLASTLYHSFTNQRIKFIFRKLDHMSIYLLIAGTYTPFCLTVLDNITGWILFGIVWACALTGIVLKAFYTGRKELLSTILYVLMGWVVMMFIKPLYESVSLLTFMLLITGGLFYTAGTFFFTKDNTRYFHSVWHVFVLAGSAAHFFAVMNLLG
ncbi:MAG: hemolysin III family protein [Cyclobacteriaceae bacterium]|nr:hemolysin III family protein [Cyclobacteriaceae bacterium]